VGRVSTASLLVTVTGRDRPGIAAAVFAALSGCDGGGAELSVRDVAQVRIHGRLLLTVELGTSDGRGPLPADGGELAASVQRCLDRGLAEDAGPRPSRPGSTTTPERPVVTVTVAATDPDSGPSLGGRQLVTVLAPELGAVALEAVFGRIAAVGGNVDRIVRLATYPVTSYELLVSGGDPARLRRELGHEAARLSVDVAVQRDGLHRRAKHLIVLDADSTLLRGEVIDMLAERAGCGAEVAALTEAAMAGRIEFHQAMEERLACLSGLDAAVLDEVAQALVLAPGARTLVRTLKRLGYVTAVVSGGFSQVLDPVVSGLGIDFMAANTLDVVGGRLTGRVVGELVDRPGKAAALERFAREAGVPLAQTIAVGDGANDMDMLARAGLGIAFNAKPVVREAADAALSVPYLDAILFLLGISREEIEAADHDPES